MRIAVMLVSLVVVSAQTHSAFEVASVKPAPYKGQGGIGGVIVRGNRLIAEHISLNGLVSFAYNLRPMQLSGGPAWAEMGMVTESELFEVNAKAPDDPPPSIDMCRQMLQTLLAERFRLRVHHVQKDLPVYNLVLTRGGPKLKDSPADAKSFANVSSRGRFGIRIVATGMSMPNFVDSQLSGYAGRPVLDKTGLQGSYEVTLEWVQENLDAAPADSSGPSLFTALQEQLGLKLEPATAPFDTLVIDRAEKPSEN